YGNIRTDEHGYMNGADVFSFAIREVPKDVNNTLAFAGTDKDEIGYFVFHQANTYMNNYLAKKLKLDKDRCPLCLDRFGNTSSVSIPLSIATELQQQLKGTREKLLLCGFGVGMSWGTAIVDTDNMRISDLVEVS